MRQMRKDFVAANGPDVDYKWVMSAGIYEEIMENLLGRWVGPDKTPEQIRKLITFEGRPIELVPGNMSVGLKIVKREGVVCK